MGILRMNRSFRWHYRALAVVCLGYFLSVTAWLVSIPSMPVKRGYTYQQPDARLHCLEAAKRPENERRPGRNGDDEEPSRGKRRFFGSGNGGDSSDRKKTPKSNDKSKNKQEYDDDQPGFFRSVFKRYGSRKEAKKAKKQAELEAILDKEARNSPFFDVNNFDTWGISSAFEAAESSIKTARDELTSVRAVKDSSRLEEQRLEELRRRAATREGRPRTQRVAEAKKTKTSSPQGTKGAEENPKEKSGKTKKSGLARKRDSDPGVSKGKQRSNPLSVAQKVFSGVFEKQREEWIPVAPKTRISPGEIVPITSAGLDLLLVASKDGSALHCIANSCPHLGTPLETGTLDRRPIETSSEQTVPDVTAELQETDIASLLAQDGCEDCIVCPLHKTAFALESGEVRGEWCPWPPIVGKAVGTIKTKTSLPVFDVRTRGKNIEVRLNTPVKI